jgi:thiamine-phosphate pyrophosphorylase
MSITLPRLYPIIVPSRIGAGRIDEVLHFARELVLGGATILQLREKDASAAHVLRLGRELRRALPSTVKIVLNDRPELAMAAGLTGVHVGQDDLPPESARKIIGPESWLGASTHNPAQVEVADQTSANYLAIGPIFATSSKEKPDPVLGLNGLRKARLLTSKPLVAIGGITLQNFRQVLEAGADSVAVIGELISNPAKTTAQFLVE